MLGNLACIVTSKILSIGSAERYKEIVKAVKTGQKANTGNIGCKKQTLIYGASMQKKLDVKRRILALLVSCGVMMIFKVARWTYFSMRLLILWTRTSPMVER